MRPLVIYHANCADGFGAAFAAWLKLGEEAEYVAQQYEMPPEKLQSEIIGRDVYILDFSFPKPVMDAIFTDAERVVWLDHHKTAFEMWRGGIPESGYYISVMDSNVPSQHEITLDNNKSGAMLAWEYFHPGKEVPMLIKHIDDHDRWQFKIEGTKEFNKFLWSLAPWTFSMWKHWLAAPEAVMNGAYMAGEAILRAHDANVQAVVDGSTRPCCIRNFKEQYGYTEVQEAKGLAANCPPHLASDVGHQLANASGTYGLLWYISKENKCKCSLRSNGDYDVSAIAKAFGGGGHKNAAGFEVPISTLLDWIK